jgi:aminoglycoside phosphotransferase (APT) family kinase protein
MNNPWDAEQTVESEQALRLVQSQFLELKAINIKEIGRGWDNIAFLINETYIFRFPRREVAAPLILREFELLPIMAKELPLPIPIPKWKGVPTKDYPWHFIGYEKLEGIPACHSNLSKEERLKMIGPIAQFLKTLHGMKFEGLPLDEWKRTDASHLIPRILKDLREHGFYEERYTEILNRSYREPLAVVTVHGDFYVRHLLIGVNRLPVGVIDWGDLHLGDPAVDLSLAHSFIPKEGHEEFRRVYGEISEETWALARLRALYSTLCIYVYGKSVGDAILEREALYILKELLV